MYKHALLSFRSFRIVKISFNVSIPDFEHYLWVDLSIFWINKIKVPIKMAKFDFLIKSFGLIA